MAGAKSYLEGNREERFFCGMLVHALLSSSLVRTQFVALVHQKGGPELCPDDLEIFIEVAALRDYWRNLGKPGGRYTERYKGTETNRKILLERILREEVDADPGLIARHSLLFRTQEPKANLWIPGHWSIDGIQAMIDKEGISEDKQKALKRKLSQVKWAFNAKPDLLLLSGKTAVLVETKLESGVGRAGEYNQYEIQELIARLLKHFVPWFSQYDFYHALIDLGKLRQNGGRQIPKSRGWTCLSWGEICSIVLEDPRLDAFTRRTFEALRNLSVAAIDAEKPSSN